MKIVVTGGAGFIGSNLVRKLVGEHDVTVIDNFSTGSLGNLIGIEEDVKIINDSSCSIGKHVNECDVIFHLGIPSSSPMYKDDLTLVGSSINDAISVFEFAVRSGAKVVFASSSSLYNRMPLPNDERFRVEITDYYTEARLCIERFSKLYSESHGIDVVGLRFFSVYGPNERAKGEYANIVSQFLWDMQEKNKPMIYGDGRQSRDFTFVDDVVDACVLSMEFGGSGIFNVGTGERHSFNDVVDLLNLELGTQIKPMHVHNPIKNYVDHTLAYTRIASGSIGFDAKITLKQGIHRLCESL